MIYWKDLNITNEDRRVEYGTLCTYGNTGTLRNVFYHQPAEGGFQDEDDVLYPHSITDLYEEFRAKLAGESLFFLGDILYRCWTDSCILYSESEFE